jgi:hypothetical protein
MSFLYVRSLCARWLNTKIMPSQVARSGPEAVPLTASQVARGEAMPLTCQVARGGPEAVLLTARSTRRQNFFRTSSPGGSVILTHPKPELIPLLLCHPR